jgi:hypothetical protein
MLFVCSGGPCGPINTVPYFPATTMPYCSSDIFNFIVPWVYALHLADKKYKFKENTKNIA